MNAYGIGHKLYSWSSVETAYVIATTPEKACVALRKAKRQQDLEITTVELAHTCVVVAK